MIEVTDLVDLNADLTHLYEITDLVNQNYVNEIRVNIDLVNQSHVEEDTNLVGLNALDHIHLNEILEETDQIHANEIRETAQCRQDQRPVRLRTFFSRKYIRPVRPRIDPSPQRAHLLRREPRLVAFLWRHQHVLVLAAHIVDERARLCITRHDRRP